MLDRRGVAIDETSAIGVMLRSMRPVRSSVVLRSTRPMKCGSSDWSSICGRRTGARFEECVAMRELRPCYVWSQNDLK